MAAWAVVVTVKTGLFVTTRRGCVKKCASPNAVTRSVDSTVAAAHAVNAGLDRVVLTLPESVSACPLAPKRTAVVMVAVVSAANALSMRPSVWPAFVLRNAIHNATARRVALTVAAVFVESAVRMKCVPQIVRNACVPLTAMARTAVVMAVAAHAEAAAKKRLSVSSACAWRSVTHNVMALNADPTAVAAFAASVPTARCVRRTAHNVCALPPVTARCVVTMAVAEAVAAAAKARFARTFNVWSVLPIATLRAAATMAVVAPAGVVRLV